MRNIKFYCALCVIFFSALTLTAMDFGEAGSVNITIDIDVNALEVKSVQSSDKDIRRFTYDPTEMLFFPSSWDWWSDGGIAFKYTGKFYGGKVTVDETGLGGLKAWVNLGSWFRVTAGTDIESVYANSLGADPGLRVYHGTETTKWKSSYNPDNITQGKGALLEGFFGPLTVALSGTNHSIKPVAKSIPNSNDAGWDMTEDRDFQYGGRLGWDMGDWGKINGSYILRYKKIGDSYNRNGQDHLTPSSASAEVFTHNFGVYASLTPFQDFGVTLGYAGILEKHLDEFYRSNRLVQTLTPNILKSGINLNARYKGISNLTLRTDHNFSFWTDKNYIIFNINGVRDLGLQSQTGDDQKAAAQHMLLWNGLGVFWTPGGGSYTVGLYLRNLYRQDIAGSYLISWNEFVVEPKLTWSPTRWLQLYVGINWNMLTESASLGLNEQWVDRFVKGENARATRDVTNTISVPVGLVMKY